MASIVGADVDEKCLQHCRKRFQNNNRVIITHSKDLDISLKFDLILCLNVLCKYPSKEPLCFETFQCIVAKLYDMLCIHGSLLIYGSNYKIDSVELPKSASFHVLKGIGTGPVPVYKPDAKTKYLLRSDSLPMYVTKCNLSQPPDVILQANTIANIILPAIECQPKVVTLGIFKYTGSDNIGDYTQTLAQINVFSTFYTSRWHMPSPEVRSVFEYFAATKPGSSPTGPGKTRARHTDATVHVVWIDRDTTWEMNESSFPSVPVYCIANGGYCHKPPGSKQYQFPFSDYIHPFFVSFHCAKETLFDQPNVVKYLKKWGPIGCRDMATVLDLRTRDVSCYFSSCLTLTLESPTRSKDFQRVNRYETDIVSGLQTGGHIQRKHLQSDLNDITPGQRLVRAKDYLESYAEALSIRGTRIHCLMPACATGTPNLSFTSSTGGNDDEWNGRSRFSGLVEGMEVASRRELFAMALFERLNATVDALLVGGLDAEHVQSVSGEK